jgi:hypothetical protein
VPRVFAVNHHPEIVDRFRQVMILDQKRERGEVSEEWYRERLEILTSSRSGFCAQVSLTLPNGCS